MRQKSILAPFKLEGIGLHTGESTSIIVYPAPANHGIVFSNKSKYIPFIRKNMPTPELATSLQKGKISISTIEHLMACFYAFNINNLLIDVDGPEIPIMDGSSSEFFKKIAESGVIEYCEIQEPIHIKESIMVSDGGQYIEILPAKETTINFKIDFDHSLIGIQSYSFKFNSTNFVEEIMEARTFGFYDDFEKLKANGFAKGASLDNAIVLSDNGVMNAKGLRYHDEFVRHKILDLIGDLSVLGRPLVGKINAYKSGHKLNAELVKKIQELT